MTTSEERTLQDLAFVGLNKKVIAVDRYSGEVAWTWKPPQGSGFISLLLDGDRLIVAISGYLYCLDPVYGQIVWENPLKGYGTGIASLASINGSSGSSAAAAVIAARQAAAAAAAGGGAAAGAG